MIHCLVTIHVYVNACTDVNRWQDGAVNLSSAADGDGEHQSRTVSNVEMLKALADPVRLNLLHTLMPGTGAALPIMSVKELAAELGEPQTKLYRHVKHLESAGLIRAVASRVVSGIVEQRYQACRNDLMIGDELTDQEKASAEAEAMTAAAFEFYRGQFFAARRASHADQPASEPEPYRRMLLGIAGGRVPVAKAAAIREQLQRIFDDLSASDPNPAEDDADTETVLVNVLMGYFIPAPPQE